MPTPHSSSIPSVSIATAHTGKSARTNEFGMRAMQERAWAKRGEPYLLIKSPPASGKSRALMFIALDKLHQQGLKQALIVVPERSIGGSFADVPLSRFGFMWDWDVAPQWNLCNVPGIDEPRVAKSKVQAVGQFLQSSDLALVCTHATFRFAFDEFGAEAFDDRLIAIDEFHHVSADPENRLGSQLTELLSRDKVHVVAMTGSYFRGDSVPVLAPEDEARFATVTYTYYEQLNGYEYLKSLSLGYFFYSGRYVDAVGKVLDPSLKTIVHIPSVNSRESLKDKQREVEEIMEALGEWQGIDPATGFHRIKHGDRILKVADLVDDSNPAQRSHVLTALKDPAHQKDRDHVDIIIALGMAKEGFDWIWCEHALTIGYRNSLTEVVQIIGRATRDAPGKTSARFTNLIAEPDADETTVVDAVNDTLKAIAASLLMEQVLAPRFDFTPKGAGPKEGFDYGEDGYQEGKTNVGINEDTGQYHVEVKGLKLPESEEATRVCQEDLSDVIADFVQDKETLEHGLFDQENTIPQETTQLRMAKIVRARYPDLSENDQEAIRQHAVAALNLVQKANQELDKLRQEGGTPDSTNPEVTRNLALIQGIRRFVNVRDLDIDLIDSINPFETAYAVLSRAMDAETLKQIEAVIGAKKFTITRDEALELTKRAVEFQKQRGHAPRDNSNDPWERRMAAGVAALIRYRKQEIERESINAQTNH